MENNTWRLVLKPKSSFITPLQSDTLFGSMVWAFKILYGEEFVEKIIDETKNYNPPFIFSNPIVNENYPVFGAFSKEALKKIDDDKLKKFDRKRIEFYKALKKKKYVKWKVFEELLSGKKIEDMYLEVLEGKRKFSTLEKKEEELNEIKNEEFFAKIIDEKTDENEKTFIIDSKMRNQINRLGNSKESIEEDTRLFEQQEIAYHNETNISIFVKIRKGFEMKKFEEGMKYISFNGYGKGASIGKGQFEIISFEQEKIFDKQENKNSFVVLSNYIPHEDDEIEPVNSNIFTKKPKAYMTDNPFKDYFVCYSTGSYFKGNSASIKGRVLENLKKDDGKSIQCLIPFIIGVDY